MINDSNASSLITKPLTRQQVRYAIERLGRITTKKKTDLKRLANEMRLPEFDDRRKIEMVLAGEVTIDLKKVAATVSEMDRERYYHSPRLVDAFDFSKEESRVEKHNKAIDSKLKELEGKIDGAASRIRDRFELSEPGEALHMLEEFDSTDFTL